MTLRDRLQNVWRRFSTPKYRKRLVWPELGEYRKHPSMETDDLDSHYLGVDGRVVLGERAAEALDSTTDDERPDYDDLESDRFRYAWRGLSFPRTSDHGTD